MDDWLVYTIIGGVGLLGFVAGWKWHESYMRQFFLVVNLSGPLYQKSYIKAKEVGERWKPIEVMSGIGITNIDPNSVDGGRIQMMEMKIDNTKMLLEATYRLRLEEFKRRLEALVY